MDLDLWDCFGRKKNPSYIRGNTVTKSLVLNNWHWTMQIVVNTYSPFNEDFQIVCEIFSVFVNSFLFITIFFFRFNFVSRKYVSVGAKLINYINHDQSDLVKKNLIAWSFWGHLICKSIAYFFILFLFYLFIYLFFFFWQLNEHISLSPNCGVCCFFTPTVNI